MYLIFIISFVCSLYGRVIPCRKVCYSFIHSGVHFYDILNLQNLKVCSFPDDELLLDFQSLIGYSVSTVSFLQLLPGQALL